MELPHSAADIVRQLFVDIGYLSDPDARPLGEWPAYARKEPTKPDDCVTVYNTEGVNVGRIQIDGEEEGWWGIQVRVRGRDSRVAWRKASRLWYAMTSEIYDRTVRLETTRYVVGAFLQVNKPLDVGEAAPDSACWIVTVNSLVSIYTI